LTLLAPRGLRFTFTPADEADLRALAQRVNQNVMAKPVGWRVLVVQDVQQMRGVISGAFARHAELEKESP